MTEGAVGRASEGLKGLSDEDQKLVAQKPLHDAEEEIVGGRNAKLQKVQDALAQFAKTLQQSTEVTPSIQIHNTKAIEGVRARFAEKFAEIHALRAQLDAALSADGLSAVYRSRSRCNASA